MVAFVVTFSVVVVVVCMGLTREHSKLNNTLRRQGSHCA